MRPERAPKLSGIRTTALRAEALRACNAEKWDLCVGRLAEARALDPAGDQSAEVDAARGRAVNALDAQDREMEAKPRP